MVEQVSFWNTRTVEIDPAFEESEEMVQNPLMLIKRISSSVVEEDTQEIAPELEIDLAGERPITQKIEWH